MSGLDGRLIAQTFVDCMAEAGFFQNCWLPSHFLVEVGQVSRQPRVVDNFCPHISHFWERWLEIEGCVCLRVHAQSCLTLCNPIDCSLLGSSVHGIFQARILKKAAIYYSRGSSQPRE